jgi:hypothetical protein
VGCLSSPKPLEAEPPFSSAWPSFRHVLRYGIGVVREVNINGVSKPLSECTIADVVLLAHGARPAAPGLGREPTPDAIWALLRETMRDAGAHTVGDLDDTDVSRWEMALGLHYGDMTDIFRSLGPAKSNPSIAS